MNDWVNTLTVDFEYNEPLYNEVPGITKPRYSEQILPPLGSFLLPWLRRKRNKNSGWKFVVGYGDWNNKQQREIVLKLEGIFNGKEKKTLKKLLLLSAAPV